jgi:prophage DNA circulation protein
VSWWDELQQASFRGVPFGVRAAEGRFGRRAIPHSYPFRDKPYIEDIGRSMRRIMLSGFLIENSLVYGGGSVIAQREQMIAAAETPGPGTLIHPTLGQLTVSVPEDGFGVIERWDEGRYFEINFTFLESGDRIFPSISTATGGMLSSLADALDLSAAADFVSSVTSSVNLALGAVRSVLSLGQAVVGTVVSVAAGFNVLVGQATRDATSLLNMASLLTGNYGRYVNANVSSAYQAGIANTGASTPTIATLIALGAQDRAAVASASSALLTAASGLDGSTVDAFPAAAQSVTAALSSSIANPGDAVRLFGSLGGYTPNVVISGAGQTQSAQLIAQAATGALLRRAAIGALARAVATYVPTSYDDAANVRSAVTACIDNEILIAGDAGDDGSYFALRALRQSVVSTLTSVGATLAPLQTFSFNAPLPSLVLAQRIYQDASRADDLVSEANPIHPAFMPASFRALAS